MKPKPNTDQFKITKDVENFLNGGAASLAEHPERTEPTVSSVQAPEIKIPREQKVFRLPKELINALKRESYERSMKTGLRVTETELVEQALQAYFKI